MSLNSTVISLVPFDIGPEEKPGLCPPRFFIPKSDMITPTLLKIGTAHHFVYLDESRGNLKVNNPSDVVAKSVVEDYINSQLGLDEFAKPAIFWIDEDINLEQVKQRYAKRLVEELGLQKKWFLNVSMIADNDWNKYHQHNVISEFQRKCAEIIGWSNKDHEWMSPLTTMASVKCAYCGASVPKDLPLCPSGHIVNHELYKKIKAEEERLVKI